MTTLTQRRSHVAGMSFEELIENDLRLLAGAGVEEHQQAPAGATAAEGVLDVARFQQEYLDRMPHGHGKRTTSYLSRSIVMDRCVRPCWYCTRGQCYIDWFLRHTGSHGYLGRGLYAAQLQLLSVHSD